MWLIVSRDTFAVIPDVYGEVRVFAGETDFDLGARESDCIIYKVGYDMLDGGAVRIDDAELRRVRPPCN